MTGPKTMTITWGVISVVQIIGLTFAVIAGDALRAAAFGFFFGLGFSLTVLHWAEL